jgi:N-acetylglucosaminyl-diphospho-decaprenol L-rhamnosyltransferase
LSIQNAHVSVLIVSYNTKDMTLACIESVRKFAGRTEQEIIVVDNASIDGSADAIEKNFPDIRLLRSTVNLGFAGANNLAAQHASAPFILLLNPDTLVLDNGIERLLSFAQLHPEAGIWGGRTFFADMSLNPSSIWRFMSLWSLFSQAIGFSKIFNKNSIWSSESYGGWARDSIRDVDIVTGCFFLIERTLWEKLGGFDLQFFMYAEEADLCFRARKLGARALFTPDATIIHYGSILASAHLS